MRKKPRQFLEVRRDRELIEKLQQVLKCPGHLETYTYLDEPGRARRDNPNSDPRSIGTLIDKLLDKEERIGEGVEHG